MKKNLMKFMALLPVLVLFILTHTYVSAQSNEPLELQACSHPSFMVSSDYYISYIYMDPDYHEIYQTERKFCNACHSVIHTGTPVPLPIELHPITKAFVGSVHEGDISTHYHSYAATCPTCMAWCETRVNARCHATGCIYINSVPGTIPSIN